MHEFFPILKEEKSKFSTGATFIDYELNIKICQDPLKSWPIDNNPPQKRSLDSSDLGASSTCLSTVIHFYSQESKKIYVLNDEPPPKQSKIDDLFQNRQKYSERKYNLTNKIHIVVRDNGSNVVMAMDLAGFSHTGCFLHVPIIVKKTRTPRGKQILRQAQEREESRQNVLILDQPTRWSSTYNMIERFLSQKLAIRRLCFQIDELNNKNLTSYEWDILAMAFRDPQAADKAELALIRMVVDQKQQNQCLSENMVQKSNKHSNSSSKLS
uniref:Transposase n=1 Tax=Romanomermis culicivorax TaxID=13658 RepID=A0A915ISU5_ROMCU